MPHFEVYQDTAGGWRWRFIAGNGNIIADSGQAYAHRRGVIHACHRFFTLVAHRPAIVEVKE